MASSRDIFRAWKRELKEDYKEFGQWQIDNISSYADLSFHYNQFLVGLAMSLDEAENRDPIKWLNQAEREINKVKAKLVKKFPEIESVLEPEEIISTSDKLFNVTSNEERVKTGLKRRKRLFPDLASVTDYISEVPYPGGIETVYDINMNIIGYYIWVEK